MLPIRTELDCLWRVHQALSTGNHHEMRRKLVEIAVEYAFLTGLAEPSRAAGYHGPGRHLPPAPDIKAEAEKILGTVREFQRFGDEPEMIEHAFKTLLKHVHYDGLKASEQLRQADR